MKYTVIPIERFPKLNTFFTSVGPADKKPSRAGRSPALVPSTSSPAGLFLNPSYDPLPPNTPHPCPPFEDSPFSWTIAAFPNTATSASSSTFAIPPFVQHPIALAPILYHGLLHLGHALCLRIMSRKRKSSSTIYTSHTSHKRKKRWRTQHVVHSSDNEADTDSEALSADEWLINCILDETESQYLIDWEGPWTPTWVSLVIYPLLSAIPCFIGGLLEVLGASLF